MELLIVRYSARQLNPRVELVLFACEIAELVAERCNKTSEQANRRGNQSDDQPTKLAYQVMSFQHTRDYCASSTLIFEDV